MNPSDDFQSEQWLRSVVDTVDAVPLCMALVHLTGDATVLEAIAPYVSGPWDYSESVPPELKARLREQMVQALIAHRAGTPLHDPSPALMQRMLDVAVGEPVAVEYEPLIRAQMGLEPESRDDLGHAALRVLIVGAGVSGICAAIKLKQAGIAFEILEKNDDVGGTWFENRYPGCAVDTPNHFYQFSFEPNDDWPFYYSRAANNLQYLQHCVDKYGIRPAIRFQSEVTQAIYDEEAKLWTSHYRSRSGPVRTLRANILITAAGQLNRPMVPDIPGLAQFEGSVVHTAMWPQGMELAGKKVALIGSGASAVQVGPAIAATVERLTIFQRSGSWIVRSPNIHRRVSDQTKWALKNIPFYAAWYRFQLFWGFADGLFPALRIDPDWDRPGSINAKHDRIRQAMVRYIQKELDGREDLLDKVVPDYPPYGKRVLADPGWFKMLRRDNVELRTSAIEAIEPGGVRSADGAFTPADIIIMATGFMAGRMLWPMEIRGKGGRSVRELWGDDDPRAYLGITAPDFPNMFVMYGPNTGVSHGGSFTFLAECQVRHIMACIEVLARTGGSEVAIKREVFQQYNADIDARLAKLVWSHPSVKTWYKNAQGRIITNSPWSLLEYWRRTSTASLSEYDAA